MEGSIDDVNLARYLCLVQAARVFDVLVAKKESNGQLCTSPGIVLIPTTDDLGRAVAGPLAETHRAPLITDSIAQAFRAGMVEFVEAPSLHPLATYIAGDGREATLMLWSTEAVDVGGTPWVLEEAFRPSAVLVQYDSPAGILDVIDRLDGQLTASIFSEPDDDVSELTAAVVSRVGRSLSNAWPTGVAVSWSMHHGGPWPASSSVSSGSVGAEAVLRFLRPVTYQNFADESLPLPLQEANPWRLPRRVDGRREAPGPMHPEG